MSDFDGVLTRPQANQGNYVQVGQELTAFRPIPEIWIDANFKETRLARLRIGQRVRCEVDIFSLKSTISENVQLHAADGGLQQPGLTAAWGSSSSAYVFSIVNPEGRVCPLADIAAHRLQFGK